MGHEGKDHSHPSHRASSPAASEHKRHAPAQVAVFVATCSDSRDAHSDETGTAIRGKLTDAGHTVCGYRVIRDEPELIRSTLSEAKLAGARAVIFNGGTGIGKRDNTLEALNQIFEKHLPGFGEIFRRLSYDEIGSPAMMSRAAAGTFAGMIVFALPGSPNAVALAMDRLILPELGHAARELVR